MWNDLFPWQLSLHSNAEKHIDSWECMAPIPFPLELLAWDRLSLSHCHSNSSVIWSVQTRSFFSLSNRDCPFSVRGPITGPLSRPLNVLHFHLIRLVETGESFEAPFKPSCLYGCSPEQSTRVCLMIVLCSSRKCLEYPISTVWHWLVHLAVQKATRPELDASELFPSILSIIFMLSPDLCTSCAGRTPGL